MKRKAPGILPSPTWLISHGYNGLYQDTRQHPQAFAHIQKFKHGRSVAEWIPIAEELVREHNGALPYQAWLKRNGYLGLAVMLRKHPDNFAHLRQNRKHRSLDDRVLEAQRLANTHGGVLPSSKWLVENGYSGVAEQLRRNPKDFAHIQRLHEWGKTIREWVTVAEELAREHNGSLPNPKWLTTNGYSGLYKMLRKNQKLFAHIRQSRRGRKSEEWVREAKRLATKHGRLPNATWLIANGYRGLYKAMRKHPKLFTHIKRDIRYARKRKSKK